MSVIANYINSINAQTALNEGSADQGSSGTALQLTLGTVTFQALEIPERLSDIGGTQSLAVHTFPGGFKTVQALGSFPVPITWEGWLIGASAITRAYQMDRIRSVGKQVDLTFGAYSWSGYVREFRAEIRNQNVVRYRINFEPVIDNSGAAAVPGPVPSPSAQLNDSLLGLTATSAGANGLPLPPSLSGPVTSAINDTQSALADAQGSVSSFAQSTIAELSADAASVQAAAAPLISGIDATLASPALSASSLASSISSIAATANLPISSVNVTNPNLFSLAAQYYGDATQWQAIANANGLSDPLPIGQHSLTIPSLPGWEPPSPVPQIQ